jgi:hypothetical protein
MIDFINQIWIIRTILGLNLQTRYLKYLLLVHWLETLDLRNIVVGTFFFKAEFVDMFLLPIFLVVAFDLQSKSYLKSRTMKTGVWQNLTRKTFASVKDSVFRLH